MTGSFSSLQIGLGWFPENPGGLDRVFYNLVKALPEVGITTHGLVAGSERVIIDSHGQVSSFAGLDDPIPLRLLRARAAVRKSLSRFSPDIVASHFAPFIFPSIDTLSRETPFIVHFHGPWAQEIINEQNDNGIVTLVKHRLASVIERIVYRRASRLIVLSDAFGQILRTEYGIADSSIRVVPGGVDTDRFDINCSRADARIACSIDCNRPLIISVRRLVRRMGLETLIDSMLDVRKRFPDALLMIIGKGPLRDLLQSRVATLGLSQNVILRGFIPDNVLPLFYRAADFSIVPTSALEGFGLVTAESLATGTPALVTPVGGLPEAVRPLCERLVLTGTSSAAFVEGIVGALSGELSLPDEIACRTYAVREFSWPSVATKTKRVYEELL